MTGSATADVGCGRVARLGVQRGRAQREADDAADGSRPWLVTVSSSTNRTIASPISSRPPTLSGRLPKPMKARMIARAPRMPVTKFGFWSSNSSP